jgi:hypothetical protein
MDYSACTCPYLSQLPWYEPTTYAPTTPTTWPRFESQFKGVGRRPKVYTPTRAYYPRKAYYPIEAYYPTRKYYPTRAYYPANYGPRSFLRDPDFYPAMPWYPFYGAGPYPYGTYDPYDIYEDDGNDDEDYEPEDDEEEDDEEEGSTHTVIEPLEREDDQQEGPIYIVTEPVEVILV